MYEVIYYCSFDLYFPDDSWYQAPFHVPVSHLYIFLEKNVYQILSPLLSKIISLVIEIYEVLVYFSN